MARNLIPRKVDDLQLAILSEMSCQVEHHERSYLTPTYVEFYKESGIIDNLDDLGYVCIRELALD